MLSTNPSILKSSTGDETLPTGGKGSGTDGAGSVSTTPSTVAPFVVPKSTRNPLFDQTSERAIRAAHRRKWTSILTLLSVVAVALGIYIWSHTSKTKERELTKEYLSIQADFEKEQETFQESQKALGAAADFTKSPDHSATALRFFDFAKKHEGHNLATQAALRASSAFIEKKEWDKATELLSRVSRSTLSNTVAQAKLKQTLAKIYMEKGEFPKAISELDFAIKLKDNPVLEEAKLLKAQALYFNHQPKEAGDLLRELANAPSTSLPDILGGAGGGSQVANEASLWLGHWGL